MNIEGMNVEYAYGTKKEYLDMLDKKDNSLYFCTDTKELFLGNKLFSKTIRMLDNIPTSEDVGDYGCLYYCKEDLNTYLYTENEWIVINTLNAENLSAEGLINFNIFKGIPYNDKITIKNPVYTTDDELTEFGSEITVGVPTIIDSKNVDLSIWDRYVCIAMIMEYIGVQITDTTAASKTDITVALLSCISLVNNHIMIDEEKVRAAIAQIMEEKGYSQDLVDYYNNHIFEEVIKDDGTTEKWYNMTVLVDDTVQTKLSITEDFVNFKITLTPEAGTSIGNMIPIALFGSVPEKNYTLPLFFTPSSDSLLCNYGLSELRDAGGATNVLDYFALLQSLGVDYDFTSLMQESESRDLTNFKNKITSAINKINIRLNPHLLLMNASSEELIKSIYDIKVESGETDVPEELRYQYSISGEDFISNLYIILHQIDTENGCQDLSLFDNYSISFNDQEFKDTITLPKIYLRTEDPNSYDISEYYFSSPHNQKSCVTIEDLVSNRSISFKSEHQDNMLTGCYVNGDIAIIEKFNDSLTDTVKKVVIDTYNGITRITGTVDFLLDTEIHPGYYLFEADTVINGPLDLAFSGITYDENHPLADLGYGLNRVATNKYKFTDSNYKDREGEHVLPYSIFLEVSEYPYENFLDSSDFNPPEVYYMRQFVLKTPGASYTLVSPIVKNIKTGKYTVDPFAIVDTYNSTLTRDGINELWITSVEGKMTNPADFSGMLFTRPINYTADSTELSYALASIPSLKNYTGYHIAASSPSLLLGNNNPIKLYTDITLLNDLIAFKNNSEHGHFVLPSTDDGFKPVDPSIIGAQWQISDHVFVPLGDSTIQETCMSDQYKKVPELPEFLSGTSNIYNITNGEDYPTYSLGYVPPIQWYLTENFATCKTYRYPTDLTSIRSVFIIEQPDWSPRSPYEHEPYLLVNNDNGYYLIIKGEQPIKVGGRADEIISDAFRGTTSRQSSLVVKYHNSPEPYIGFYVHCTEDRTNYEHSYNENYAINEVYAKRDKIYHYSVLTDHKSLFFEVTDEELAGRTIVNMSFRTINYYSDEFGTKKVCLKVIISPLSSNSPEMYEEYYFTIDINKTDINSYFTLSDNPETKEFVLSKNIITVDDYKSVGYTDEDISNILLKNIDLYSYEGDEVFGKTSRHDHNDKVIPAYYHLFKRVDETYDILVRNYFGEIICRIPTNSVYSYSIKVYDRLPSVVIIGYDKKSWIYSQGHFIEWRSDFTNLRIGNSYYSGIISSNFLSTYTSTGLCLPSSTTHNRISARLEDGSYYLPRIDYEGKGYNALYSTNITDSKRFFTFEDKDGNIIENKKGTLLNPVFSKGFKMSYEISNYEEIKRKGVYKEIVGVNLKQGTKTTYEDTYLTMGNPNDNIFNLNIGSYSLKGVNNYTLLYNLIDKSIIERANNLINNATVDQVTSSVDRLKYFELKIPLSSEEFLRIFSDLKDAKFNHYVISHGLLVICGPAAYGSSELSYLLIRNSPVYGYSIELKMFVTDLGLNDNATSDEALVVMRNILSNLLTDREPQVLGCSFDKDTNYAASKDWYPLPIPVRNNNNMLLKIYDKNDTIISDCTIEYYKKDINHRILLYMKQSPSREVSCNWQEDNTFAEYGYHYSTKLPAVVSTNEQFVKIIYEDYYARDKTYLDKLFPKDDDNLSKFGYVDELNTVKIYCKEKPINEDDPDRYYINIVSAE